MTTTCIVILSDFGEEDPYQGIMKGVISRIAHDINLIDLTHQLPPGDIQAGAFQLWQAVDHFPSHSVFLAVVDPGVGTNRKGLFVQRDNRIFIGPDNGLFSYLGYKTNLQAWELTNPTFQLQNPSTTFHGRDIFAPAAAFAALGHTGEEFGDRVQSPVSLPKPICRDDESYLTGEIISSDRFGNLITSLGQFQWQENNLTIDSWIGDWQRSIPSLPTINLPSSSESLSLVTTFADIPPGSCAALIGSSGLLEIAANQESAADLLRLSRGDQITLNWK
jgi:S-adenosylmethionine hydrolase